jgi:transmembrane sensor
MRIDNLIEAGRARRDSVEWDAITERRVLHRVLAVRRAPIQQRPRRLLVATLAAAACVAVLTTLYLLQEFRELPVQRSITLPVVGAADETDEQPTSLTFADGSSATMLSVADVQIEQQTSALIALDQHSGRVRYEVARDPFREFVVQALDVEVRASGTVFVFEVAGDAVVVTVEEGVLEVNRDRSGVRLIAGEELRLTTRSGGRRAAAEEPSRSGSGRARAADPRPAVEEDRAEPPPPFETLLKRADRARRLGNAPAAAEALEQLVRLYPRDGRIVSVLFTLGKVEASRGRHLRAARAFRRCGHAAPRGTLAEDALAAEARAWQRAGRGAEAATAARRYLDRFPTGPYAAQLRAFIE